MMKTLMPLGMARPDEMVSVVAIKAGFGLKRRLADMGLSPGVSLRVIQSQVRGPVIIDLRGSRLALGRGMAQRILVQEA